MIQAPLPVNYAAPAAPIQQPAPEYNAIKINIVEPKVNAPGSQQPAQSVYGYPQAPIYNYPQATQAPVYFPPVQTAPVQQQGQVIMTPAPAQTVPVSVPAPQVINQQTINQVPPSVIEPEAPKAEEVKAPEAPVEAPKTEPQAATINVPAFTQRIKADDLADAGKAIEEVADIAQTQPEAASQLLDTDLMEALLGVIGKDSSTLEGPSDRQKELRQQVLEGKQLSEADMAEANKITPLEMAERNKQYALFTTAILQNSLIDEFKKTNNITPDIKDLPGMEQIVTTIKDNPNPMLRASGLAALAYNARPEYKSVMKEIFELSKQDADENVQKVAEEGLAKLATVMDAPAATEAPSQAA
ncbi:MAG: hypothetical protein V8R83_01085 [Candidatus Gastranaerophilaceae bacterium]